MDGAFWQWNDIWLSEDFRAFDIRAQCRHITAPLLAIQGVDDPYGTMAQIDEIAAHAPHTRLLKLPDCGHSPHRTSRRPSTPRSESFWPIFRSMACERKRSPSAVHSKLMTPI